MKQSAAGFPETRTTLLVKLQSEDDETAWQDFVAIYRPVIYRMACRRGLQEADAQDLVQKVLLSVSSAIETWEGRDDTPFRHWLRRVTSNAILKWLSRRPIDEAVGGSAVMQMLNTYPTDQNLFERELDLEHQREVFLRAAAIVRTEVEPKTWQAFQLSVVDRLPIEEVASMSQKTVGAAYAARGRVMQRLKYTAQQIMEGSVS